MVAANALAWSPLPSCKTALAKRLRPPSTPPPPPPPPFHIFPILLLFCCARLVAIKMLSWAMPASALPRAARARASVALPMLIAHPVPTRASPSRNEAAHSWTSSPASASSARERPGFTGQSLLSPAHCHGVRASAARGSPSHASTGYFSVRPFGSSAHGHTGEGTPNGEGTANEHTQSEIEAAYILENMIGGELQNAASVVELLSDKSRLALHETLSIRKERENAQESGQGDPEHVASRATRVFSTADLNRDGVLTKDEFVMWYSRRLIGREATDSGRRPRPAPKQLFALSLRIGLPFVGFGFLDNFIMIMAGNTIESSIGVTLGLSTMAAAALGNTVSDVAGIGLGNTIEAAAGKLGLPNPNLSTEQGKHWLTKVVRNVASIVAIALGCVLGMIPLLFMEDDEAKQLRAIFDSIDVNGDGDLSAEELRMAFEKFGIEMSDSEFKHLFEIADLDDDDRIDFEEFCLLVRRWKARLKN
eukprot:TRINITY_DN13574_c0_g1_i1.p1 TRINITY_DN13574_c0_g1~~TRINITY_DN13574_c0_g1_i1.p1  ORF type:complete len:525 (+),score=105.27 TRINITY_DN13574_c0_g1_i1:143-1576(+)